MGGSPCPSQVRVRVKLPCLPADIGAFRTVRGLFHGEDGQTIVEELTEPMVRPLNPAACKFSHILVGKCAV